MKIVCFEYRAKFGHFLRAEANANGITYPLPPRTALLGLIAAVLGLAKDALAQELADAHVAVGGRVPRRFWHRTNVRKDPPTPIPWRIKKTDKGSSKAERNFRFPQEWLWQPDYRVWASLPGDYHDDLVGRLRDRRWHFTPCMGLSEMLADLEFVHATDAMPLGEGTYSIGSVAPHDPGRIDTAQAAKAGLTLQSMRMPFAVTKDRIFQHRAYWLEHHGQPFPFRTNQAWQSGPDHFMFL